MPIQDITDTALITAYARATEAWREDALFQDYHALALAGERGAELARETEAFATIANSVACRTAVFDELISSTVKRESIELVINLAAGLDTRPFRLELPPGLRWVDVDRGSILEYKRNRLTGGDPTCEYQQCSADLTKSAELHRALEHAQGSRRTLVFTEGLLVYLSEPEVAQLATRLHSCASIEWWITDIAGPRALDMMQKAWGQLLANAEFQFAPPDAAQFFQRHGWHEHEFRSSQEEAQRLGRARERSGLARIVIRLAPAKVKEELRRLSGVAVLKRVKARA